MELYISLIALIATFYELRLQRVHNEKSLKPLIQVDLRDRNKTITVHVSNNGVGPFIIKRLTFIKDGRTYSNIEKCLQLDPKIYFSIPITEYSEKVILPQGFLEVFSTQFSDADTPEVINNIRQQIAALTLQVKGRDIYNNKITIQRNLQWFVLNLE